jgi:hypothetical protein
MMDLFQLLKLEHEQYKKLIERLHYAEDEETRQKLFNELKNELIMHFYTQTNIVYPATRDKINAPELFRKINEVIEEIRLFYFEPGKVGDEKKYEKNEIKALEKTINTYLCLEENLFRISHENIDKASLEKIYQEVKDLKESRSPRVTYFKHDISA